MKSTLNAGDVVIVDGGKICFIVVESFTDKQEKEYIFVNTEDFKAEVWSKELNYTVGDYLFDDILMITEIIPRKRVVLKAEITLS